MQANSLLEAGAPTRVRRWAARRCGRIRSLDRGRARRGRSGGQVRGHLRRDPPSSGVVALHDGSKSITEVAQQMPPVRDLDSIWRPLPDAVGVDAGAIARNDLHAWVLLQPRRKALGSAVG